MENRIGFETALEAYKATLTLSIHTAKAVPEEIRDLVKLRASQINGCSFCIDMHWKEARRRDEPETRLYQLDAWRESTLYSAKERAALAWTEAVTRLDQGHVSDEVYAEVKPHFSAGDLAELTYLIATANVWNRLCIAFRLEAGTPLPRV